MQFKGILFSSTAIVMGIAATMARADDIKIGFAAPLTGPQAYFGTTWLNGVQLYVEKLNAAGGINGSKVVIVPADDKADAREGTIVAQRFCDDDGIKAVIGHFNSGITIPTMDIYSGCDLTQITVSTNPQITELNYPNIIQPVSNDFAQGKLSATYAYRELGARNAASINDKQAFGQGVAQLFDDNFKALGGKISDSVSVDAKDVDFSSVITKLKQSRPDVVYFGGVMPQIALLAKQMHDLGLNAKLLVPDGAYAPDYVKLAGDPAVGTFVTFQAPPYDSTPELQAFADAYKAKYGDKPGPQSALGWMQMQVLENAIKATPDLDRAAILKNARATDMDTVAGHIKINDKGGIDTGGLYMFRVEKDGFTLVGSDQ